MYKKQGFVASILISIALALSATACIGVEGARVGDLQTKTQTVELGDADSVDVEIQMGAGDLDVSGGASELLEASFTYNVEELNPGATYTGGTLVVEDSGVVNIGIESLADLAEYRSEWDLKFNEDVSMAMKINLGAGPSNLALGDLNLTWLNVEGGAGDFTVDLTGDWHNDLDASIGGGLGSFTVRLPDTVGVIVEVEPGLSGVDAGSLTRDGNRYVNDAYGVSDVTLRIDLNGGVGEINLDVE